MTKEKTMKDSKKIIAFDLDGTLTESKTVLDEEMSKILCELLARKMVAVIGGGSYKQFQAQFLAYIACEKLFKNLFLLPTSGSSFYEFKKGKWRLVYRQILSPNEKKEIKTAFKEAFEDIEYEKPKKIYGTIIEDRDTQITFSAIGQKAPLGIKGEWNRKEDRRRELKTALEKYLPEFEIRLGGLTSLDITKKGIDKAYGVNQIMKVLSVSKDDIVYVGDALYEGGNDAAVLTSGVETIQISGPEETKNLIRSLLATLKQE